MRYLDSATRQVDQTSHGWLREQLSDATTFACQSGYFRFDALLPFVRDIDRLLRTGGRFDLVVGANEEALRAPDLEDVLQVVGPWLGTTATATLVAASDVLFHPKTIYVERPAGRRAALVGSGNLTGGGTRNNVEAAIALDERDDASVLDAIRDAILAWPPRATSRGNARPITQQLVDELTAEGAMAPTRLPLSPPRRVSRSPFPPLGPIPGLPSFPRPSRPRRAQPIAQIERSPHVSATQVTGIVKRLSRTDVKGFDGREGTAYVALPVALRSHLPPMHPAGRNGEPRLNLAMEGRVDAALSRPSTSGIRATNIQHVGAGRRRRSHSDLRLNLPVSVTRGLLAALMAAGSPRPAPGDALAVEFLDDGRIVRLTFASHEPLRSTLLTQLQSRRSWGWLPANVVPPW